MSVRRTIVRARATSIGYVSYAEIPRPKRHFVRSLLCLAASIVCCSAEAVSAYAGAFNGPSGTFGSEDFGILFATASTQSGNGHQGMYAKGTAEAGALHAVATAYNDTGSFQFATTVVSFNDEFTLSHPDGVNQAVLVWVLRLDGICAATGGATNGRPNATCYSQASLNAGSPWEISMDHAGEVTVTATVTIVNGFGNANGFPISPFMQVGGYATNGSFLGEFQNTAQIYAYSTTPGVSLLTASGHDYSLPVPEPATPSLFLCALSVALLWRKFKGFI